MHPRNTHPSGGRRSTERQTAGFTLIELFVAVAVISLLMVLILPALAKAQTKMRSNRCLSNLQDIGTAASLYLQDSNDKFPYAALRFNLGLEEHHLSWDDLMGPYLGTDITASQRNHDGVYNSGSFKLLTCPQDTIPVKLTDGMPRKEFRRSYAMPEHNLGYLTVAGRAATAADWPPCPVNQTGLGLRLEGRPGYDSLRWNPDDEPGQKQAPRWQAAFQTSMIMSGAKTIFMTEHFNGANRVGAWNGATIASIAEHTAPDSLTAGPEQINYLMADGHVESLVPADSYASTNRSASAPPSGFWTVLQYD